MSALASFIAAAIAIGAFVLWFAVRKHRSTQKILNVEEPVERKKSISEPGAPIEMKDVEFVPIESKIKRSSLPPPLPDSTSSTALTSAQHEREVARLRKSLGHTRQSLVGRLRAALSGQAQVDAGVSE